MQRIARKNWKRMGLCVALFLCLYAGNRENIFGRQEIQMVDSVVQEKSVERKRIALTFDDGPHPVTTSQLLKGLRERKVRVTFFVTGKNAERYPKLIRQIAEEGHLLGNHTYSHLQYNGQNAEQYVEEVQKTNELLQSETGEQPVYIRPPYGSFGKEMEERLQMFPVLWTIDPLDWCRKDVEGIVRDVCGKAEENGVILMHDQYASTVTAAFAIIDRLQAEGYEFVTVDELILD